MLHILGVSRSGYNSWLYRLPSNQQKRKKIVEEKISERTVGKYMK
ncbi:hypothetical protein J2Z42_000551 [Clostridium algifaecis]|uniref:Transposase n=1 Tax=Clostridium algifaecis TaxID=1472040 RepID=A0ABS4KQX3_9CLOT|nr:hypothetical protein [Clostridium algifaecis]